MHCNKLHEKNLAMMADKDVGMQRVQYRKALKINSSIQCIFVCFLRIVSLTTCFILKWNQQCSSLCFGTEPCSVWWSWHSCFNFKLEQETVSYEILCWKYPVLRAVKPCDHIRDLWGITFTRQHQRSEDLTGNVLG